MRREFPNVNDEIIERQRQVGGCVLAAYEPQRPERASEAPKASVIVKRVRRSFVPVVEVVSRSTGGIAELERRLVVAYNTPSQKDEEFLRAACDLAEALMGERA